MNLKAGVIFLVLVGVAASCSCVLPKTTSVICSKRHEYIISAKIMEVISKVKQQGHGWDPFDDLATTPPSEKIITTSPYWRERERKVLAKITKFYKGKGRVDTEIELRSGMMGSMCGWGESLIPGREVVFTTNNLKSAQIDLCDFKYDVDGSNFRLVKPLLEHHDCGCKVGECKLREGRRVLKGACHWGASYCERDGDGQCWWKGATIEQCRWRGSHYWMWD